MRYVNAVPTSNVPVFRRSCFVKASYPPRIAPPGFFRARGVRGVLPDDLDDLTQDTVLGAWRSMRAGRFRTSPALRPADAFRPWLAGIASRQASHYRDKAYRRHELPRGRP
ncbi:hypothetical protein WME97_39935 [Sorangium sp. So ce367]|uniref:hypothetical protein n=1 Tax=Sorangium sp. So ce367 TaxID=3133305 RepID=UPI003F6365F9